ncbi:hypothetical protein V5799_034433 [Amblyomma americanum]|uniref:Uncharacterized protein n=1 Tax=Amblyomma americanum TaxID=6943 RepID=A0AAQ4DKG8_AMBAM
MDSGGGGYPVEPAQQLQVPSAVAPAATVPPPVVVPPPPVVVVSAASGKPPAPAPPILVAPAPPPPVVPIHHPAMGPHLVQDQARYSNPPGHRWMSQTTSAVHADIKVGGEESPS